MTVVSIRDEISTASTACDAVLDEDVFWFTDLEVDQALGQMEQLQRRVAAVRLRLLRSAETRGLHSANGHKSMAAWQAQRHRSRITNERVATRTARRLEHMTATDEALAAAQISDAHVTRLASACRPKVQAVFQRDEEMLVGFAKELSWKHFEAAVSQWELFADPDRAEGSEDRRWKERSWQLDQVGDGHVGVLNTDMATGEFVERHLSGIEKELFEADWAAAREIHGDLVCAEMLARTPGQRRHDAMIELLRRGAGGATNHKPQPEVAILIDAKTLEEELERFGCEDQGQPDRSGPGGWFGQRISQTVGGLAVTPRSAVALAMRGHVRRVVYESKSKILDAGYAKRFFTDDLRRILEIRDRGCVDEWCDAKAWSCEADHVVPVTDGGRTSIENGQLLCSGQHRAKTNRENRERGSRASA